MAEQRQLEAALPVHPTHRQSYRQTDNHAGCFELGGVISFFSFFLKQAWKPEAVD